MTASVPTPQAPNFLLIAYVSFVNCKPTIYFKFWWVSCDSILVVMLNVDDSFSFGIDSFDQKGRKETLNSLYSFGDQSFRHLGNVVFGCIAMV